MDGRLGWGGLVWRRQDGRVVDEERVVGASMALSVLSFKMKNWPIFPLTHHANAINASPNPNQKFRSLPLP